MMEFKVTIDIIGIPEALNNLAAAIRGQAAPVQVQAPKAETPVAASTPTAPAVNNNPATQPLAAPFATGPVANTVQTGPATAAPLSNPPVQIPAPAPVQEKKITAEDISRAGAALVDQGKMADVINLLKRYGVQAITQLKEDVYPAFVNDLRALGATI